MTLRDNLIQARDALKGTTAARHLDVIIDTYCPDAGGGPNLDPDADEEEEKKKGIKK